MYHGDPAFGQGPAVPLLKGERLQPHHQPQQPHLELFWGSGLCRFDHLIINGGQSGSFGDSTRYAVDHPDLLRVKIPAAEGLPHGRQAGSQPAGPGQQTARLVGLVTQHDGQLIGYKLAGLDPTLLC